ncbi:MAG: dockerin type I repeat-containing protein [Planctomycetota bacterium]
MYRSVAQVVFVVSLCLAGVSYSQPVADFVSLVDVDGDGSVTPGDTAFVGMWLERGGQLSELLREARSSGGILDASEFFQSAAAEVPNAAPGPSPLAAAAQPATTAAQSAAPVGAMAASAAQGSGSAAATGTGPCATSYLDTLPVSGTIVNVGPGHTFLEIQAAILASVATNPSTHTVIAVHPRPNPAMNPYAPLSFDPSGYRGGLTIYSVAGPSSTYISGNGGPAVAITGTGAFTPSSDVKLGLAVSCDPTGWHGFTITNGNSAPNGGGVFVNNNNNTGIHIRGNIITGNVASQDGGGIYVEEARNVQIVANEVSFNVLDSPTMTTRGAGIALLPGLFKEISTFETIVVCNDIHDNAFDDQVAWEGLRIGGGLYSVPEANHTLVMCANDVYRNNGMQGAGVAVELFGRKIEKIRYFANAHIDSNHIFENDAFQPVDEYCNSAGNSYQGGGLFVDTPDSLAFSLRVYNNVVERNDITFVHPTNCSTGPVQWPAPSEAGGGAFIRVNMPTVAAAFVEIVGNALNNNSAFDLGGGAYIAAHDLDSTIPPGPSNEPEALVHLNTFSANTLSGMSPLGVGVFFPGNAGEGAAFDASTSCVFTNVPNGPSELAMGATDPQTTSSFRYTQMPPGAPFSTLFNNNTQAPLLNPNDWHIGHRDSPSIGTGDPGLLLAVSEDADGDPRVVDVVASGLPLNPPASNALDRGADEYVPGFRRGDANGDGATNIADVVAILNQVFGQAYQNVADASDTNDDGSINVADGVYLYTYLFNGGTPPPAPFGICGVDPTPDSLPVLPAGGQIVYGPLSCN